MAGLEAVFLYPPATAGRRCLPVRDRRHRPGQRRRRVRHTRYPDRYGQQPGRERGCHRDQPAALGFAIAFWLTAVVMRGKARPVKLAPVPAAAGCRRWYRGWD